MSPLKYFVTDEAWSLGVFSAAQMLLNDHRNIVGILQAALCLYNLLALLQLHITCCYYTSVMKVTLLYRVYRLQYSIELSIYSI